MTKDYVYAAQLALINIGRIAKIDDIWREIEMHGDLRHQSKNPKQTLRNEMRKSLEDFNHKQGYEPKIFTSPERGFYGLVEWNRQSQKSASQINIDELLPTVTEDLQSLEVEEEIFEGERKSRYSSYYERNPKLRAQAISIHGTTCMVRECSFNFEKVYGERGKDFIEVHHLQPLNTLDATCKNSTNPHTDLVVVCSNCHRIIHRQKDRVLSLAEVGKLMIHQT